MSRLVNNVSGTAANTDPVVNLAPLIYNTDPLNVQDSLLYTVYGWATTWGGAQIQLFISPQDQGAQISPVWFPLLGTNGSQIIISSNEYINFSVRFGIIKGEVVNASSSTAGLCCTLFNPSLSFPANSP